jgi:hypothetical protein
VTLSPEAARLANEATASAPPGMDPELWAWAVAEAAKAPRISAADAAPLLAIMRPAMAEVADRTPPEREESGGDRAA